MILTLKDLVENNIVRMDDSFIIKQYNNETGGTDIVFDNSNQNNNEIVLKYSLNSYKVDRMYSVSAKDSLVIRVSEVTIRR